MIRNFEKIELICTYLKPKKRGGRVSRMENEVVETDASGTWILFFIFSGTDSELESKARTYGTAKTIMPLHNRNPLVLTEEEYRFVTFTD